MTTFSLATVRPLVMEILRSEPDKRFGRHIGVACRYWDYENECPDCVIGRLLARLGLPVTHLIPFGRNSDRLAMLGDVRSLFDDDAFNFICDAQDKQDTGTPWGEVADSLEANE